MAIPVHVQIVGDALNTQGFEAFKTIDGVGLNTLGFLWSLEGIWGPGEDLPASTTWTDCGDCVGIGAPT